MKNILLVSSLFFAVVANAQIISIDKTEANGVHHITTKPKNFKIRDNTYSVGLMFFECGNNQNWYLLFSSFSVMSEGDVILLKLKDGQTITLDVDLLRTDELTSLAYIYNIGNIGYIIPEQYTQYYSSVYEISQSEMDSIESQGISKIRIGNDANYIEGAWLHNPLGKYIKKNRKVIMKRLENPIDDKPSSIYDGF